MNNSKLNEALKRFWTLSKRMCWWRIENAEEQYAYHMMEVPSALRLGGTPLLQTAYVNVEMTKRFVKTYGVDKLNVCYLTDGLGGPLTQYVGSHENDNQTVITKTIPTRDDYPSYDSDLSVEKRKGRWLSLPGIITVNLH